MRVSRLKLAFVLGALVAAPSVSGQTSTCLPDGTQASGAIYRICMPAPGKWNGDLVIYAHGYDAFNEPIDIPEDELNIPGGPSIPEIVNGLGFAFGVSSFSTNGLAILQGIEDSADVVKIFAETVGAPRNTYIVGPSQGGIITALSLERLPRVYRAALSACGPVGDFPGQVNYIGDFRVIFEYFFPGVIPGSPFDPPDYVINNWDTVYVPAIKEAVLANPDATRQLISVTKAPTESGGANVEQTVVDVLWYAIFSSNDATIKLGGQPFDNIRTIYRGSDNDRQLNANVVRVAADPAAIAEMETNYNTTGVINGVLITLHTSGDQIIPYWHERLYRSKINSNGGDALHTHLPVNRYGHCNFTVGEIVGSFVIMLIKDGQQPPDVSAVLRTPAARADYVRTLAAAGISANLR